VAVLALSAFYISFLTILLGAVHVSLPLFKEEQVHINLQALSLLNKLFSY